MEPEETTVLKEHYQTKSLLTEEREELVFIRQMAQVVCKNCYNAHFSRLSARPFEGKAYCQSLHPQSNHKEMTDFDLWATFTNGSTDIVGCYYCLSADPANTFKHFSFKDPSIKHQCKELKTGELTRNHALGHIKELLFTKFHISTLSKGESLGKFIEYDKGDFTSNYFSKHLYFERISNTIALFKHKSNTDYATFLFLQSFAQNYFYSDIYTDYINDINQEHRKFYIQNARKELKAIMPDMTQEQLDIMIYECCCTWTLKKSVTNIIYLLSPEHVLRFTIKTLRQLIKKVYEKEELITNPVYNNMITVMFIRSIDTINGEVELPPSLVSKLRSRAIQMLVYQPLFFEMLNEFCSIQKSILYFSTKADFTKEPTNSDRIRKASDYFCVAVKAFTYNEIPLEELNRVLDDKLQVIKECINCTFDIKKARNYSNKLPKNQYFTKEDKMLLLINTNVVRSLVLLFEFIIETTNEAFVSDVAGQEVVIIEIMNDLLSIFAELSNESYEVSIFLFKSLKVREKIEQFENTKYIKRLQSILYENLIEIVFKTVKLKDRIINMNLPEHERFSAEAMEVSDGKFKSSINFQAIQEAEIKDYSEQTEENNALGIGTGLKSFLEGSLKFAEENYSGKFPSLQEVLEAYTNTDTIGLIKFSNYVNSYFKTGLRYYFDKNYLKKQVSNSDYNVGILYQKEIIVKLCKNPILSKDSMMSIFENYLNENGDIGMGRFSRSVISNVFNVSFNDHTYDGKIPLKIRFEAVDNKSKITFSLSDSLNHDTDKIINKYVETVAEHIQENKHDLPSSLKAFNKMMLILGRYKYQLFFLSCFNKIKEVYIEIITRIRASDKVQYLATIPNFTAENIQRVQIKEDKLVFEETVVLPDEDIIEAFETRIIINSPNSVKKKEKFASETIIDFFSELDLDTYKMAVNSIMREFSVSSYENLYILMDILNNFVDPDNIPIEVLFNEVKPYLSTMLGIFFFVVVEYLTTYCKHDFEILNRAYYSFIVKFIRFIKSLIDYNRMGIRKYISNAEIPITFVLNLNRQLKVSEKEVKFDIFSLFSIIYEGVLDQLVHIHEQYRDSDTSVLVQNESNIIELLKDMNSIIREILEGGSEENLLKVIRLDRERHANLAEVVNTEEIEDLRTYMDSFYLSLYSEVNASEEVKSMITKMFRPQFVKDKMIKKFKLALSEEIDETIELSDISKAKRVIDLYNDPRYGTLHENSNFKEAAEFFNYLYNRNESTSKAERENPSEEVVFIISVMDVLIKRVEVSVNKQYSMLYFLSDPTNNLLSSYEKKYFLETMDRSSSTAKKEELIYMAGRTKAMAKHYLKHNYDQGYKKKLINLNFSNYLKLMMLMALVNVIVFSVEMDHDNAYLTSTGKTIFYIVSSLQILGSLVYASIWYLVKFKLGYKNAILKFKYENNIKKPTPEQKRQIKLEILFISRSTTVPFVIIATCIGAMSNQYLFWLSTIQLLFIANFSSTLMIIFRAVTNKIWQLLLVSIFLGVQLLIFAFITFAYLRLNFNDGDSEMNLCKTPMHCFTSQFDYGLRMGGGMADHMAAIDWNSSGFWKRFLLGQAHYLIFPIVMLNIVAGIIIDTFAELREETQQYNDDMNNFCVICSLDRNQISRQEGSFNDHITKTHPCFNYVYFINFIMAKKRENCDFFETYVRQKISVGDFTWFPDESDEEEINMRNLKDEIKEELETRLKDIRKEIINSRETSIKAARLMNEEIQDENIALQIKILKESNPEANISALTEQLKEKRQENSIVKKMEKEEKIMKDVQEYLGDSKLRLYLVKQQNEQHE